MKKVAFPRSILALSVAVGGFLLTPHDAAAGTAELKALATQLNGGVLPSTDLNLLAAFINSKPSSDVAQAVVDLTKIKPISSQATSGAGYAGEALKRKISDPNFGTILGQTLNANQGILQGIYNAFPTDATKTAATKAKFIGFSAKNAATSSGAFSDWIDEFAFQLTANNLEAYAAAKNATASKTAVGLIVASRSNYDPAIDTDAERLDLAQQALLAKSTANPNAAGLSAAAQEISRYVGDSAANAAQFAHDLVATPVTISGKTTQPLLIKMPLIATGTATSNPSDAPAIVNAMFDGVSTNLNVVSNTISPIFTTAVKNASKLASGVSLVADAEQVQSVAVTMGTRIGLVNTDPTTFKTKVVGIAQTSINTLVKGFVLGLTNRPTVKMNVNGDNRTNRIDEIGETGAYLMNAIKNLPDFQGKDNAGVALTGTKLTAAAKRAASIVTGLIKTIITNAAKVDRSAATGEISIPAKGTLVKAPIFQATVADDVAGSVAQTVRSLGPQGLNVINSVVFDQIKQALLNDINIGTKLAGSSKTLFTVGPVPQTISNLVKNALIAGFQFGGIADQIYEDGTNPALAIDNVNGAETDVRSR